MLARRTRAVILTALVVEIFGGCTAGTTSQPTTTTAPPQRVVIPLVDMLATPAGWAPVDFGDAQISVPASWRVYDLESGFVENQLFDAQLCAQPGSRYPAGAVLLGTVVHKIRCPEPKVNRPIPIVSMAKLGRPPHRSRSAPVVLVRGIETLRSAVADGSLRYAVPSLGIEIGVLLARPMSIIGTLTRSPMQVVLAKGSPPVVPRHWRTIEFSGVRFSVPAGWPVQRGSGGLTVCGGSPPANVMSEGVFLDIDNGQPDAIADCRGGRPAGAIGYSDGVAVYAGAEGSLPSTERCPHLVIARCRIEPADLGGTLYIQIDTNLIEIGLAGNGLVARTILFSLRSMRSKSSVTRTG